MTKAKEKELLKIINDTLEMLEKNPKEWLEEHNKNRAEKLSSDYAWAYRTGIVISQLKILKEIINMKGATKW